MIELPANAEHVAYKHFVMGLYGKTVANARDLWALNQDGTLTIIGPDGSTLDPGDSAYDDWTLCGTVTTSWSGDMCAAFPVDGYDLTFRAYPDGCPPSSRQRNPNTIEYVACPVEVCVRLYLSDDPSGSAASAESLAAPNLGSSDFAAGWGTDGTVTLDYFMLYDAPASSTSGGTPTWSAVNAPAQYRQLYGLMRRLDGDLLAVVQNGGTIHAQIRANARSGVGVSEGSQVHYAAWAVRVYRPGTGFVNTTIAVSTAGATNFPAQSTHVNRMWDATLPAYGSAQTGDYLVIDLGNEHDAPTSGATGAGLRVYDTSANDLPEDEAATSTANSWVQICGYV